ncbi:MAG: PAS domain-containing sensor histidine kinase [Leeuwenhoekiella sp.]
MIYDLEPFFELSLQPLFVAGYDGYFKKVNPAFSKLVGYSIDELTQSPIDTFVHPEDVERNATMRSSLMKNAKLRNYQNRYITKAGEIIWLSWHAIAHPEKELVYATATDITHLKNIEEERNQLLFKATSLNKELKQNEYMRSHDLRAPVHNLRSIIELIDFTTISDEETLELLDAMRESVDSLNELLSEYLDTPTGDQSDDMQMETIDLHEILRTAKTASGTYAANAKAIFDIDFTPAPTAMLNKNYLLSIFLNLITNSIKYARHGVQLVINVKSGIKDGILFISYRDNGQGFDMEKVQDRIFGLRQTFSDHKYSKGIGLYLVHNHVTSMGGKIEVCSVPGEGTTFQMRFQPNKSVQPQ